MLCYARLNLVVASVHCVALCPVVLCYANSLLLSYAIWHYDMVINAIRLKMKETPGLKKNFKQILHRQ